MLLKHTVLNLVLNGLKWVLKSLKTNFYLSVDTLWDVEMVKDPLRNAQILFFVFTGIVL